MKKFDDSARLAVRCLPVPPLRGLPAFLINGKEGKGFQLGPIGRTEGIESGNLEIFSESTSQLTTEPFAPQEGGE